MLRPLLSRVPYARSATLVFTVHSSTKLLHCIWYVCESVSECVPRKNYGQSLNVTIVDFRRHKYLRSIHQRFRFLLIFRYYSTRVLTRYSCLFFFVDDTNISQSISTDIHLHFIRLWYLSIRRDCRMLFTFTGWCLVTNNSIANSLPAFVLKISHNRFVFACLAVRAGKPMFTAIQFAYPNSNGVNRHVGAINCLCVPFLL